MKEKKKRRRRLEKNSQPWITCETTSQTKHTSWTCSVGQEEPVSVPQTVQWTDLVASVLVEHHQHQGHDHNHTDHDGGVEHGVERALTHRIGVLTERSVDPAERGTSLYLNRNQNSSNEDVILLFQHENLSFKQLKLVQCIHNYIYLF